jgi:hypothetical protein
MWLICSASMGSPAMFWKPRDSGATRYFLMRPAGRGSRRDAAGAFGYAPGMSYAFLRISSALFVRSLLLPLFPYLPASPVASKQANKQTSKQANKQTSKQANKQARLLPP